MKLSKNLYKCQTIKLFCQIKLCFLRVVHIFYGANYILRIKIFIKITKNKATVNKIFFYTFDSLRLLVNSHPPPSSEGGFNGKLKSTIRGKLANVYKPDEVVCIIIIKPHPSGIRLPPSPWSKGEGFNIDIKT